MNLRRFAHRVLFGSISLIAASTLLPAHSQEMFPPLGSSTAAPRLTREMLRERNTLRQRELVENTNRLLELAQQLKQEVDKSNEDQLSLSVVNKAAEIEKLARSVKDKMRKAP